MDRGLLNTAFLQPREDRRELFVGEHQVTHRDRAVAVRLERDPGTERKRGAYQNKGATCAWSRRAHLCPLWLRLSSDPNLRAAVFDGTLGPVQHSILVQ